MASAKKGTAEKTLKNTKKIAKEENNERNNLVTFLNIREGYLPGEQILVLYFVEGDYTVNSGDSIALQKCGTQSTSAHCDVHVYKWPVSTKRHGAAYKIKLGLPNPDRKQKCKDYQFVYLSCTESERIMGRSRVFKISDIIELDDLNVTSDVNDSFDVNNKVDRELFSEPVTPPRPIKLYNAKDNNMEKSTASVQVDHELALTEELKDVLNSRVTTENMIRVTELIEQYEKMLRTPQRVKQHIKKPETQLMTAPQKTVKQRQSKVAELLQNLEKDSRASVAKKPKNIPRRNELFLEGFVFPFLNGALEYLMKDGYVKIVCRNNKTVLLQSSGNKVLDLGNEWEPIRVEQEMRQLPNSSLEAIVDDLTEKYKQISDELESLKHDSEIQQLQYVAELKRLQARDMRKVNSRLRNLECKVQRLVRKSNRPDTRERDVRDSLEAEVHNLSDVNSILAAHIKVLEQELADKSSQYVALYNLLDESTSVTTEPSQGNSHSQYRMQQNKTTATENRARKMATNTDHIKTREESTVTEEKKVETANHGVCTSCRPRVQKATSYAASTPSHIEKTSASNERKHMAISERGLADAPVNNDQSWSTLLQKLFKSKQASATEVKPDDANRVTDSNSSDSLAQAMRNLFRTCSSASLASAKTSCQSVESDYSTLDAIRQLFGSNSSLLHEKNSYPATPCNSADHVPRNKKKTAEVKHSSSVKDVLRWLFQASEEDLKKALPTASKESISSLGEAMRRLFGKESSPASLEDNSGASGGLSTSNESLAQAMHMIFGKISQQNIENSSKHDVADSKSSSSSLGSLLMWGLAEPTPEEYKNVDAKKLNQEKLNKKNADKANATSKLDHDCHHDNACGVIKEKTNPTLSSVIRSSSPDSNINISFPSSDQTTTLHKKSAVPKSQTYKVNNQTEVTNEEEGTKLLFTTGLSSHATGIYGSFTSEKKCPNVAGDVKQTTKSRRSRRRRIRSSTKKTCTHCNVTMRSRMRKRLSPKEDNSSDSE